MFQRILLIGLMMAGTCAQDVIQEPFNGFTDVVNKSIIAVASQLSNLYFETVHVNTGPQEFGTFNLTLNEVNVTGLNDLVGEIIDGVILPIKINNVTIYVPEISVDCADYSLTGSLIFPIGNKLIPLTGDSGKLRFGFTDVRVSFQVILFTNTSGVFIPDMTMYITAGGMTFDAENLMGGGDLGWAFNTVLNDVVIVAFNYFKDPLIAYFLDDFKALILQVICSILPVCKSSSPTYDSKIVFNA